MIRLFGPEWFLGFDQFLDVFSIVASLLVAWYSYNVYKVTSQEKTKYLSVSFSLIGVSFITKVITNYMIYQAKLEFVTCALCGVFEIDLIYIIGYFMYKLTFLAALIILLILSLKIKDKNIITIISVLGFMLTFFSQLQYYIFHITAAFFLFYIAWSFDRNYRKLRTRSCFLVCSAFWIIFMSQLAFIFVVIDQSFYVMGEIIQLVGYILLIINHIRLLRK